MRISQFRGPYFFLSNFFMYPQEVDGVIYPSNEHFYQSQKAVKLEDQLEIRQARTPGQAKRLGRRVRLRPDWFKIRLSVMEKGLRAKFSDKKLEKMLLSTYPAYLEEGNTWGDTYWGVDLYSGRGANNLGKLLMKIRAEILKTYRG